MSTKRVSREAADKNLPSQSRKKQKKDELDHLLTDNKSSSQPKKNPKKNPKKKSKKNDLNHFFIDNESPAGQGSSSTQSEPKTVGSTVDVTEPTPHHSKACIENDQNELSNEQLLRMVQSMSAAFAIAIKHLNSNCETIHLHRTKATLGVSEETVSDEDVHLLVMFNKYNLPLKTKEEIEKLDAELEMSKDFLKFFVSCFF